MTSVAIKEHQKNDTKEIHEGIMIVINVMWV